MNVDTKTPPHEPFVSVIMPVFNCELYIESAIRSVIGQTFRNLELIVIDDCSTDSTCSIVQRICQEEQRVRLIQNPVNMGVAKSRNRGLDICKGDYVAFLDADDIWMTNKLSLQIEKMEQENADLSFCSYGIIDDDGKLSKGAYIVPERITYDRLLKENVIGCSTVVLSNNIANKYRFVTDLYHEDYCLWLEIIRDGYKVVGCSETLVHWRLLSGSRSFNKKRSAINRWKIYRKFLKLSFLKSLKLFLYYVINGIKKYYR